MKDREQVSSTVEKLLMQAQQREQHTEIAKEKLEDYKRALNAIAASENGQFVFSVLVNALGVFKPIEGDGMALVRGDERKNVYLKLIRPYLEQDIRSILENV